MTENNAAQPGLTDDKIRDIITDAHQAYGAFKTGYGLALGRAIESALLSKLRAEGVQAGEPVADERAAFEEAMQRHGQSIDRWPNPHGGYRKSITDIAWYVWLERAALANPPAYAKASDAELDKLYRETITEGPENDIRCWENPHRLYARAVLARYAPALASAPVAEEPRGRQGVSVERLAKDPFLAAQLWRNPVDRAPVAGEAVAGYMVGTDYFRPDVLAAARIYAENRNLNVRTLRYADAAPQASEAVPLADCYSNNDGDSWLDCPDDIEFVHGLKVGDEYELKASIWAWPERFRVTKVPDDTSDDYEVEPVSVRSFKTQADKDGGDCAKGGHVEAANQPETRADIGFGGGLLDCAKESLLDYAMAIAHERELDVLGHKHNSDEAVERFKAAVERALPTPSVVKQSLTTTQTGEKGEKDAQ